MGDIHVLFVVSRGAILNSWDEVESTMQNIWRAEMKYWKKRSRARADLDIKIDVWREF